MIRFLLAFLLLPSLAHAQDGLLPVEDAYRLKYELVEPGKVALHWQIAKDYYLYKGRIKLKTDQAGLNLGAIELPAGKAKYDEFFGDVEIYHDSVDAIVPYTLADPATDSIRFVVTVQGCHEVDPLICYPPHPVTVTLDGAALAQASSSSLPGTNAPAFNLGGTTPLSGGIDEPALPAEQAFRFEAIATSPTQVLARWTMPKGYYLYRDKTVLTAGDGADVGLGEPTWPIGVDHVDEHFGNVVVYFDQVELPLPMRRANGASQSMPLTAEFQGCKENGICYPVMQRTVNVDLPAATTDQLASATASFVPMAAQVAPAAATQSTTTAADNALRSTAPPPSKLGLLGALLAAVLGGLVLNLMPCVLPVLSFKLIGLAESGESLKKARSHALWYSAGVLASFAAIGLLVIGLRSAGLALGWGFQLQQPLFVGLLVYLMLAVGLSLSGVFQIGGSLAGVGQGLANRSGPAGDFFTGVLACVVASPCTAPFMGGALAYAFAASPIVALLVFLALGLGLALPFLLIGFVPALARRLPRPGAWMDTFKQVLAFPMYLTAVWLVWVLGQQRGIDAVGLVLIGAVVLALALWWYGRGRDRGIAGHALTALFLIAALAPLAYINRLSTPTAAAESDSVAYSRAALDSLLGEGRTVFVNMTADWCTTCKLNERTVLGTDHFRGRLKQTNAVYMKGDWTNVDPEITAFLEHHQAVGVPLYIVFKGKDDPGQVLPTLLTQSIVDAALSVP
ncbi:MAG: protein-disulfide reductase DsbD [Dokdonella sp.]